MNRSAEDAATFVQTLALLAGRLSAGDLVVSRLHCDWASFGSWSLEVQRGPAADAYGAALLASKWDTPGPEVARITCDGREKHLVAATSPTPPLSAPNQWTIVVEEAFRSQDEAIARAEQFLNAWGSDAV